MTRGIIRGAARAELRTAVQLALDPDALTTAEITEEAAHELCGEPGHVWRTRLCAAMQAWGEPRGYEVGTWERPYGPWQISNRRGSGVSVTPGDSNRAGDVDRVEVRVIDGELNCVLRLAIDTTRQISHSIWIGPAQ